MTLESYCLSETIIAPYGKVKAGGSLRSPTTLDIEKDSKDIAVSFIKIPLILR